VDYIELSIKDVEKKSKELASAVASDYKPEVVIFVAKGAYQIGQTISDYFNIPLLEIRAKRKVGKLKKFATPFLKLIPRSVKKFLREREVKSNVHDNNTERNVYFEEEKWNEFKSCKNVLIVDDSVDTGNTLRQVREAVVKYFENGNVKLAALNVFEKSESIVKIDYCLWKNTMLCGPWSSDSNEKEEFVSMYKNWKRM